MRKFVILGSLIALFGFAAAAQASDRSRAEDRGRLQPSVETDSRGDDHDRYERAERSRERHDEARERHESRADHDRVRERRDRR